MEFLKNNTILIGVFAGLLVPFVGYAVLLMLSERLDVWLPQFTEDGESVINTRTVYLLAVCCNLLPFHFFDRNRLPRSMRGVMLATLLLGLAWLVYFGKHIME